MKLNNSMYLSKPGHIIIKNDLMRVQLILFQIPLKVDLDLSKQEPAFAHLLI